ncbi:hypothetical protein, partial [uncultured Thiodictyon sp.]
GAAPTPVGAAPRPRHRPANGYDGRPSHPIPSHPIADGDLVRLGGTEVRIGLAGRINDEKA